jgi:beta-glucosidase
VPLVGFTWWPMFALVTWAYRQGHRPISDHLGQMGLWDLDANLNRIPTPLVDAYRALVSGGSNAAGRLNQRQVLEERESDVPQLLSSGL